MKIYNPFQPHVVEFSNGMYAVRKLTDAGWKYYDTQRRGQDDYWWWGIKYSHNFLIDNLERAQDLCELAKNQPQRPKVTRTHT